MMHENKFTREILDSLDKANKAMPSEEFIEKMEKLAVDHIETNNQSSEPSSKVKSLIPIWVKYLAAASFLAVASVLMWPSSDLVKYQVASNDKMEGILPDQSSFTLNAMSTLSYDPSDWSNERTLHLEGEAFFRVQKGSDFKVVTNAGEVTVLGTVFNVKQRGKVLEVKCTEGRVSVTSSDGNISEVITANQAIQIQDDGITQRWEDSSANMISWVNGVTRMKDVPFEEVILELERQYNIRISVGKIDVSQKLSCNFPHNNLNLALTSATAPLGLKYKIEDKSNVVIMK